MSFIKTHLLKIFRKVRAFALKGRRYYCPVCGGWYRKFLGANRVVMYSNVKCPGCLSFERHRLLWIALCYLQNKGDISFGGKMLHVAPESCLEKKFRQEFDYLSINIDGKDAMLSMDLTKMSFQDESFNAIVCKERGRNNFPNLSKKLVFFTSFFEIHGVYSIFGNYFHQNIKKCGKIMILRDFETNLSPVVASDRT